MRKLLLVALALALCTSASAVWADTANVTFAQLTGLTGGSPAQTAVYRADLSGLGLATIQSLTIIDSNSQSGGSPGKFSGFDLDAVKLAYNSVNDASQVNVLTGLAVFDFLAAGTIFVGGTQRPTSVPDYIGPLFGTSGGIVNNTVATLGSFDGNSTTDSSAFGFVTLGDGGRVSFNLTSTISTTGLFLYIGEVGDNGEVAEGTIFVSDRPAPGVPVPPSIVLLGSGILGLLGYRRFRK
jgi:hypothetical protein